MLEILRKFLRRKKRNEPLTVDEKNIFESTKLRFISLTDRDFSIFYQKYFVFTLSLPYSVALIDLLEQLNKRIRTSKYIHDFDFSFLTEEHAYSSETFFISNDESSYISKIKTMSTIRNKILSLLDDLEKMDEEHRDYFKRVLTPFIKELNSIYHVIRDNQ